MVNHRAFRASLQYVARALAERHEIGRVLYAFTDHTTAVLGCQGAGMGVCDAEGTLQFVAATGEAVARIERFETEAKQGPCHQALQSGRLVVSPDLTAESRWSAYTPRALQAGIGAVVGTPLIVEGQPIGMLDAYWVEPQEFADEQLELVQVLADLAAALITNLGRLDEAETLADQLQHALGSRVVIEQAKGIIAERADLDPPAAFEQLRSHARSNSRPIHEVARAVVEGELEL